MKGTFNPTYNHAENKKNFEINGKQPSGKGGTTVVYNTCNNPITSSSFTHAPPTTGVPFRPRIIQTFSRTTGTAIRQRAYFPVPRERGIVINTNTYQSSIIRVPRDNCTPLVIYNPVNNEQKTLVATQNNCVTKPLQEPNKISNVEQNVTERNTSYSIQQNKNSLQAPTRMTQATDNLIQQRVTKPTADSVHTAKTVSHPLKLNQWTVNDVYSYLLQTHCSDQAHIFKEQVIFIA